MGVHSSVYLPYVFVEGDFFEVVHVVYFSAQGLWAALTHPTGGDIAFVSSGVLSRREEHRCGIAFVQECGRLQGEQ